MTLSPLVLPRPVSTALLAAPLLWSSLGGGTADAAVKVAFTGDQGVGDDARAVLSLIADEGTDLLLVQGDLGYAPDAAAAWEANLDAALGPNFPVLAVVGNHENHEWPRYRRLIERRIERADGLSCTGEVGVKATCRFAGLEIAQVAPGIHEVEGVAAEDGYAEFLRSAFSPSNDAWRICSWHKNQTAMQTDDKGNATGWAVYDACLDLGAMIATAHQHAYSRTFLMDDFERLSVAHRGDRMRLEPGRSFAFVSGLGGREVREQRRGGHWWASVYTASQGATHGALFCTFETSSAECYFKAIDGAVPDRFTLSRPSAPERAGQASTLAAAPPEPSAAEEASTASLPAVFRRTDKDEYRWIDRDGAGGLANVWISRTCADSLGGPTRFGDWGELMALAPGFDAIAGPCAGAARSARPGSWSGRRDGYVFSRTDKREYRWIAPVAAGAPDALGSVWIDEACANRFGGPSARGDWDALMRLAPGFDEIAGPCD